MSDSGPQKKYTREWTHFCPSHGWFWWHAHRPVELWVPFHGQKTNSWNDDTWSSRTRKACEVSCCEIFLRLEFSFSHGMNLDSIKSTWIYCIGTTRLLQWCCWFKVRGVFPQSCWGGCRVHGLLFQVFIMGCHRCSPSSALHRQKGPWLRTLDLDEWAGVHMTNPNMQEQSLKHETHVCDI